MERPEIRQAWEEFITEYQQYFPDNPVIRKNDLAMQENINEITISTIPEKKPIKKSTIIKPKTVLTQKEIDEQINTRIQSEYQELTKKMSIQNSSTTETMFKGRSALWYLYHDSRDFSFAGYDNQAEIPVNKIISYLETKKNHKLKILDLGCGRNLICQHFKDNKKFDITGYDYVPFNNSKIANICNLPDEDDSVKICIYSQSLMGSNWKEYLNEGNRVLEYNGEMIISESIERYDVVKSYLQEINMYIKKKITMKQIDGYIYLLSKNKYKHTIFFCRIVIKLSL